ncbi:hypothetical protein BU23DRAFT_552442 [Bimuria novae-zelandiae CBS 107.79]|uniref:Uncharacterized protein n=1 Tax=Bimuria novae-zelandiae CBS 107.79 TaxID=1447943 RepID=A0A6A5VFC5_9PLEO|nr:hypothetical protein BU23DRAFT_552442 [Bimuria novae-zelandiae CBS 107.79]
MPTKGYFRMRHGVEAGQMTAKTTACRRADAAFPVGGGYTPDRGNAQRPDQGRADFGVREGSSIDRDVP